MSLYTYFYIYIEEYERTPRKEYPDMSVYIYISRSMKGLQEGVPLHVRVYLYIGEYERTPERSAPTSPCIFLFL